MDNSVFTRAFEVESRNKELTLYQHEVGDVSCVVWDAALVLAKYLDVLCREDRLGGTWLEGKTVVELGAGVGCVGMTAACLGAHVVMTDLESAMPMLERNIAMNESQWRDVGTCQAQVLDWERELKLEPPPDIVLLADCVYYKTSIQPLIGTLVSLCNSKPSTYAILSQEERDTPGQIPVWREFLEELTKKFKLTYISQREQHPMYRSEDIHLIQLNRLN